MFQEFNRTEKSWGKAAHIAPEALERILASGDSLKKIGPMSSKSSKKFKVWSTETISIERKSKERIILSTSQDKAVLEARSTPFEPIPSEAYDEVLAVLAKHGLNILPRTTISSHKVT